MDQAVGNKIADYLIKPVNPNQILIAIKKILHSDRLVSEQTTRDYREEFNALSQSINSADTIEQWYELYSRLVHRELELAATETNMDQLLEMQKTEANSEFAKWVKRNYEDWVRTSADVAADFSLKSISAARQRRQALLYPYRQLPPRPVAQCKTTPYRYIQYRGRAVHIDTPHRNPVCPQRNILRTHASGHRETLPRPLGR